MKNILLDEINPSFVGQEVYGPPPEPNGSGLNVIIPISALVLGIVFGIIVLLKRKTKKENNKSAQNDLNDEKKSNN